MNHDTQRIAQVAARAGKSLLAGAMALALTPAMAFAQPLAPADSQLDVQAQAKTYEYGTGYDLAESTDGTIMWPDGKWVDTDKSGTYSWKTYVKGDNAHYGHYDATITFTVDDDVLTAIDITSEGTTVGGRWGTLTPHDGAMFVIGYLPEKIVDKTDVTANADGGYTVTPNLEGAQAYGGSSISELGIYQVTADGAKTEVGTIAKKTSGRGAGATTSWVATPAEGQPETFASFDAESGVLTVAKDAGNLVLVKEQIGDYYVFGQYYGLDDTGEAGAWAVTEAEKTDMAKEPTGIGAKDRDVYTAAAYSLILQRELPSWMVAMNDESATGEIEDLDIISAATKSSDAVIESLYAAQGYAYPIANHDDATAQKASWDKIFSSVSPDLAITLDGEELDGDATSLATGSGGQRVLNNALFGDDIAIAGFDLYAVDAGLSTAELWDLGKGKRSDEAQARYMTNYVSKTGHGLVGAYGLAEGQTMRVKAEDGGVADVLDDDVMSYDAATKALTVKDPSITHVVVQYAVGKFSDPNGGVCGVVYDLDELAAQGEAPQPPAVATQSMLRLYNPNSGEHFYTASQAEKESLVALGWNYEGIGWTAPVSSQTPVYRLYNPNAGDHHYTTSAGEKANLVALGWNDEGIGWYSDDDRGVALLRLYNPNATGAGAHHYTTSAGEKANLISLGWNDEGIGWYGR